MLSVIFHFRLGPPHTHVQGNEVVRHLETSFLERTALSDRRFSVDYLVRYQTTIAREPLHIDFFRYLS